VGDDANAARYRRRAQARGVGDRVTLVGGGASPRPYYGAADAFVATSIYDPSPEAALEAMACALPVIASPKSGAAELLREHHAGLICASGDAAGLAAQMQTLQDPSTRAVLSVNARRAVLPLSPTAITLQQVLLYRDLLTTRGPGRAGSRARAGERPAAGPMDSRGTGPSTAALPLLDTPAEPRELPPGRR
jgi:UDP-glucose:(heptosyl)LPS alpha-1,3-glucosyltransferase